MTGQDAAKDTESKLAKILAEEWFYEGQGYGTWGTLHEREKKTWRMLARAALVFCDGRASQ